MIFKTPIFLILIPLSFALIFFAKRNQKKSVFVFPTNQLVGKLKATAKVKFRSLPFILRLVAIVLFTIALSGPRLVSRETIHKDEGIDIVLALDASGSMAAEDFKLAGKRVNRLAIVKNVISDFVDSRANDRLGLVAFAGLAYTVCPLTTDNNWLQSNLERIELGLIQDGTAVGSAIASSITRLKQSDAKSKVVILLTDGMNNAGEIDPLEAARAAEAFGIKIYTIGAGTKGYVPFPATDFFGRKVYTKQLLDLDETSLKEIAKITNGQYFRATDTESLRNIYNEIDKLEKTEIEEIGYFEFEELFKYFLLAAMILLVLEIVLANTVFLTIP